MRKLQLVKESAIAALFFIFLTFLLNFLPFKFEFTKGIRQGLFGFDIYDLHFSNKHLGNANVDSRIVLIEIGNDRNEIAGQLETISKYKPKVVGIDAFFEKSDTTDQLADLRLQAILSSSNNFVLANRNVKTGDSIKHIGSVFQNASLSSGYADFTGIDNYITIRSFYPFYTIDDSLHEAFSTVIAKQYNAGLYQHFKDRDNEDEIINYTGNLPNYISMTREELLEYDSTGQLASVLEDKIVLVGYFVKRPPFVLHDFYFTPLNERVAGKSHPDMYGVVIHANILSMILNDNYATMLPGFVSYVIAYVVVFFLLLYLLKQYKKRGHPNHGLLLLLQLGVIFMLLYIFLILFDLTLIKVDLVPLIVGIVLSIEAIGFYKMFAVWLHGQKRVRYQTIFSKKAHL